MDKTQKRAKWSEGFEKGFCLGVCLGEGKEKEREENVGGRNNNNKGEIFGNCWN